MKTPLRAMPPADRPPDGGRLYAIVYISTAAHLLSIDELEHLRDRAQARNLEHGVTGILLYADGAFMQYLEGPAAGLMKVYGFIKADPLHYGVIDLLREPIQAREFAGWSMALRVVGGAVATPSSAQGTLLAGTPAQPPSAARRLLLNFCGKGRSSVASTLRDFSTERARRIGDLPGA